LDWRGTSYAVDVSVMEDQHQRSAQLVRITVALTPSLINRLDERRRHSPDLPDRGELIRRLLEKALSAEEERERGRERERGAAGHDSQHSPGVKPPHTT
jgi:metal-responsive CopG/Arc/MetJ family transcriptional regulator